MLTLLLCKPLKHPSFEIDDNGVEKEVEHVSLDGKPGMRDMQGIPSRDTCSTSFSTPLSSISKDGCLSDLQSYRVSINGLTVPLECDNIARINLKCFILILANI